MNFRTTYILFGAVAIGLLIFVIVMTVGTHSGSEDFALRSLHELARNDEQLRKVQEEIDTVEVERVSPKGETLVFKRVGERDWKLQQPYEAKIDSNQIRSVVDGLVHARIDKTADVSPHLGQLGLDPPSAVVILRKGDKSYSLKLGNLTLGGVLFALSPDAPKEPMAISRNAVEGLFRGGATNANTAGEALKSITDFRPRNLLLDGSPLPWDQVTGVRLFEGKREVALAKTKIAGSESSPVGSWLFVKPEGYGPVDMEGEVAGPASENIAGLRPMLTALTGLRIPTTSDEVIEGPANLAEYGLAPGQDSWRVELDRMGDGTEVLHVGKKIEEKSAEKPDPNKPASVPNEKVWVRVNNENFVVKLPAKALEPIRKLIEHPSALRDRNLVDLSIPSIDAVEIKLPGEKKIELRKVSTSAPPPPPGGFPLPPPPPQWRIYEEGSEVSEQANFQTVSVLLNALSQRRLIRDFPDGGDDKTYALDQPAAEIAIWQDGIVPEKKEPEKKDEKKDEKKKDEKKEPAKKPTLKGEPNVRLKFGKKEKDIVYVRRQLGIYSAIVTVPDSLLPVVSKKYVDYLDLKLPSFVPMQAVNLSFNRGPVKYEVEKDKTDTTGATWKIVQPTDQAGRKADDFKVQQILNTLSTLQAGRVFARKPTEADLASWGLKPPRIEASVTLQDSSEPFAVQIGKEYEDKQEGKTYVYVRMAGKDTVFLTDKHAADVLMQGEIQDTTIFRLDPARVQSLKLTGWKDAVREPTTLEFIRKGPADWSAKDKPDYKVDAQKVEEFLQSLALVRTEGFVAQKGEPKAEYGLDVKDRALSIEITLEGEKTPITLSVGALEKDGKTYYATSNKAPGAVFLVFKERFEPVRLSPEYFLKR
ncbi:MAG TPA: DUF4340 domain-containing protein [Gemmataceae bacterium]|jgi:hypothetical protein|nr:DUF4340 domain-containing protein [Gemmataceae bacterium]